ncbi:MAG: Zn-dependent protease [Planctomycetota bacterium]|nr:Zn-dependent protease [Planctomycetota bacterium]
MFSMPGPTPYDLNFRALGIPVRVSPWFWAVTAIMGYREGDWVGVGLWIGCVFVSILAHEYGHGLTSRAFGLDAEIALHGMGGLCRSEGATPRQRLLIILAGPAAGFLLCALVLAGVKLIYGVDPVDSLALVFPRWFGDIQAAVSGIGRNLRRLETIHDLIFINLFWGIFNLMPVYPLDGGQFTAVSLTMWRPRQGMSWALMVSMAAAICLAIYCFQQDQTPAGIFLAFLAVNNYQTLQLLQHRSRYGTIEEDPDWWKR